MFCFTYGDGFIHSRAHYRTVIEAQPMASRIQMIRGSSIAPKIIGEVHAVAAKYSRILVCLDSKYTHDHRLAELQAYASLASKDSYCAVFDTLVKNMPKEMFSERSWELSENPKTAVWGYLKTHPRFEIDGNIHSKLLIAGARDGYLKRVR